MDSRGKGMLTLQEREFEMQAYLSESYVFHNSFYF